MLMKMNGKNITVEPLFQNYTNIVHLFIYRSVFRWKLFCWAHYTELFRRQRLAL
jgi:hypothetical protein